MPEFIDTTLPSHGVWYSGRIPDGKIKLRGTTVREDIFWDAPEMPAHLKMQRVLSACLQFPDPSFKPEELTNSDAMAAMLAIRATTYGSKYDFAYTCTKCATENKTSVDFANKLDVREKTPETLLADVAPADMEATKALFKEPITVVLPVCGKTVNLRMLRSRDNEEMIKRNKSDKLLSARKEQMGGVDMSPLLRLSQQLVSVDGKELTPSNRDDFLLDLPSRDRLAIETYMDKLETGISLIVTRTCKTCQTEQRVQVPVTMEFFRGESGVV